MTHRVYSEEEVAALLRRTVTLQKEKTESRQGSAGLTIEELEAVAMEAGLDPRLLRQAANELRHSDGGKPMVRTDSTETHNLVDKWVPGTISADTWGDVVALLKYRFDSDLGRSLGMPNYGVGSTDTNGRTHEWRHTSLSGVETRLLIHPGGDGTRVRLSQRVGWASPPVESSLYGFIVAAVIAAVTLIATTQSVAAVVMLVSLIGASSMIYKFDQSWRGKKHVELEALADRIVECIEASGTEAASKVASGVIATQTAHGQLARESQSGVDEMSESRQISLPDGDVDPDAPGTEQRPGTRTSA